MINILFVFCLPLNLKPKYFYRYTLFLTRTNFITNFIKTKNLKSTFIHILRQETNILQAKEPF